MNFKFLPLIVLMAVPGLAHECWQVGLGFNNQGSSEAEYQSGTDKLFRTRRKEAFSRSIMAGCQAWAFSGSDLSLTGEYQFRNDADLELTNIGRLAATAPAGTSIRTMRTEHWAPGVQWNFHHAVDWGVGLQYRFTRLQATDLTTRNDRPWFNAYIGHTFSTDSRLKPYVALRQAVALSRTRRPDLASLDSEGAQKQLMRALDGVEETSLQVGIRF